MERMRAEDTDSLAERHERKDRKPVNLPAIESAPKPGRFVLPGEIFQA
jgi:hypothetical protein